MYSVGIIVGSVYVAKHHLSIPWKTVLCQATTWQLIFVICNLVILPLFELENSRIASFKDNNIIQWL